MTCGLSFKERRKKLRRWCLRSRFAVDDRPKTSAAEIALIHATCPLLPPSTSPSGCPNGKEWHSSLVNMHVTCEKIISTTRLLALWRPIEQTLTWTGTRRTSCKMHARTMTIQWVQNA